MTRINYQEMTALYNKYNSQGLEIVAFPCNQFGAQEPGTNAEIKAFARDKYGFKGLMMAKINVNGPNTDPVWVYLKEKFPGDGEHAVTSTSLPPLTTTRDSVRT